jgi:hypothetical protein
MAREGTAQNIASQKGRSKQYVAIKMRKFLSYINLLN